MDIKLNPELEALLARSAEEAGREPSALLDEIVRIHLARQTVSRAVEGALAEHERGESIPFDRATYTREQNKRLADVIARAKP